MFGTALNYTALRILGMNAEHPVAVKARATLHRLGRFPMLGGYYVMLTTIIQGGQRVPLLGGSFGWQFSMSTIGRDSILFLLSFGKLNTPNTLSDSALITSRLFPDWVPFHPHKWWIHTRNVYIPMSYLYGIRFKMEENDLIRSLREVYIHRACHTRTFNTFLFRSCTRLTTTAYIGRNNVTMSQLSISTHLIPSFWMR